MLGNVTGIEILDAKIGNYAQNQGEIEDAEIDAVEVLCHLVLHHALYPKEVSGFDHQIDEQEEKEIGQEFAFHACAAGALICRAKVRESGEKKGGI